MDHKFKNNPDIFCYICCDVFLPNHRAKITDFVKNAYPDYFGVNFGDQDMSFASHVSGKTCVENMRNWRNDKMKCMAFAIPMVWGKEKYHNY